MSRVRARGLTVTAASGNVLAGPVDLDPGRAVRRWQIAGVPQPRGRPADRGEAVWWPIRRRRGGGGARPRATSAFPPGSRGLRRPGSRVGAQSRCDSKRSADRAGATRRAVGARPSRGDATGRRPGQASRCQTLGRTAAAGRAGTGHVATDTGVAARRAVRGAACRAATRHHRDHSGVGGRARCGDPCHDPLCRSRRGGHGPHDRTRRTSFGHPRASEGRAA
ncbi:hypothetical protein BN978_07018 [Mycolicibacterium mageritense DSM 44476 = CIP 104973]|nr:hypothetical protein BN978_07018 [Mycolicibacterium mageritense DSM 44476 = CIP 104973]